VGKGTVEPVSDGGWWQSRAACSSSALQAAVSLSDDGHGPRGLVEHNTRAQRLESPAVMAVAVMRRGRMSSRCWTEGYGGSWRRGLGARRRVDWMSEAREWQGLASHLLFFCDAMRDGCPGSRLGNQGQGRKRLEMGVMIFFYSTGEGGGEDSFSERNMRLADKAAEDGREGEMGMDVAGLAFFCLSLSEPPPCPANLVGGAARRRAGKHSGGGEGVQPWPGL
jgi:hypothetical protein